MNRWIRLVAAVVAMIMIANLQYAWTLFVKPIIAATGWKLSDVQWGFTFFIAFETWMMPLGGWVIDRIGARYIMSVAGLMCGIGWASIGHAHTLTSLYVFYSLAGFGASLVYCGSLAVALRWFPDRRGLAAGLIAGGFGSGAALFIPIIRYIIRIQDYRAAFLYTGIAFGAIIICAAQLLKNPPAGFLAAVPKAAKAKVQVRTSGVDMSPLEMLRTPHFYCLYAMMLMMGIGGLIVTAQAAPLASTLKISSAALTLALSLNPIANGISRVSWGWVSDHLGRQNTMALAFLLQSACLVGVVQLGGRSDAWFVASLALVFFTWGEVYVLFPSAAADFFGSKHVSSNYGFLYSTKGVASIVGGGLAALIFEKMGSWNAVFYGSAILALLSSIMAFTIRAVPMPTKSQEPELGQAQATVAQATD